MRMNSSQIISSDNLETTMSMKKKWNQYILCLALGCIWGLICQFAMVGTIALSSNHKISYTLWFEGIVIFFCSVVNTGGPLVVRYLIIRFASEIDTRGERESKESMTYENVSICVLFGLLGSNLSVYLMSVILAAIVGEYLLLISVLCGLMIILTFYGLLKHLQDSQPENKSTQIDVYTAIIVAGRV